MSNHIHIVVVDSHTLSRDGLRDLVSAQPDMSVVRETAFASEAVAAVTAERADVVVLDTKLPDGDGLALARELRDRHPELGIVLLTSNGEDDVLFRALEIGVSAFVPKIAPVAEVLVAIRHSAVAAGSFIASGLSSAIARRRAAMSVAASRPLPVAGGSPLSPREAQVLEMLGRGVSVVGISTALHVSHSTAKTYVSRVYEKLGATNRSQALMLGLQRGLISRDLPAFR